MLPRCQCHTLASGSAWILCTCLWLVGGVWAGLGAVSCSSYLQKLQKLEPDYIQGYYYGKPVSVLNADVAKSVFLTQKIHSIQYIKYHTVGEEEGSMPVIQIDRMCIHRDTKEWIEKPYLALSTRDVTKSGEYEMILNPAVIIGGI